MGRLIWLFALDVFSVLVPAVGGSSPQSLCDVPEEERPEELVESLAPVTHDVWARGCR